MTAVCPRAWEAEAVSDGRLGAGERFSFERHAQGCVVCRREIAELSALDATMRELSALESSPFERQRLRGRLLRQANQELFGIAPRRVQARWFAVGAASLFIVGIALGWVGGARPGTRDDAARAPSPLRSVAPGVPKPARPASASVSEPETRSAPALPAPSVAPSPNPSPNPNPNPNPSQNPSPRAASHRGLAPLAPLAPLARGEVTHGAASVESARTALPAEAQPVSSARGAAARDTGFAAGVAAFRHGEYANADRILGEFSRGAAGDPRREDAAFLRAVARSRLGDVRGAADLAASYLKSFPNGLRRVEAERIVHAVGANH